MDGYTRQAYGQLQRWIKKMKRRPSILNKTSKGVQNKINGILPKGYHEIVTSAIKNTTQAVISGSEFLTKRPLETGSLRDRERLIYQQTKKYKTTAMLEGAGTGAGGILLGLADLPLLLSIKIKLLYEMASIYGFDVRDYRERLFILYIFQLAFSSKEHANKIFNKVESFNKDLSNMPDDMEDFDWRAFQQEYRDYIDVVKLLQMIPGVGAFVGAYVNTKLVNKLIDTAMQAYRLRILSQEYPNEGKFQ